MGAARSGICVSLRGSSWSRRLRAALAAMAWRRHDCCVLPIAVLLVGLLEGKWNWKTVEKGNVDLRRGRVKETFDFRVRVLIHS